MELHAVGTLSCAQFVQDFSKHVSAEVRDQLHGSSRTQVVQFSDGLLAQVQQALHMLEQYIAQDEDELQEDAMEAVGLALQALLVSANLATELLNECHEQIPSSLKTTAEALHDHALLALGDERQDVQDAVAKLCCAWWTHDAPHKELLVSQTLPYLVVRALSTGKAAHVKACYSLRAALHLLDFHDPSIADMMRMLLRAAMSPAFLHRQDGRKFLSCLLTVDARMAREMAAVIRNQIPAGRRSVLDAYGEIILRGWREATGACLAEIEDNCVQGLMCAAISASRPTLAASLRTVLSELHGAKKMGVAAGSVDSMLVRLYEPILFRGLSAANPAVRRNALELLFEAFPLADPETSDEEVDALLRRQFSAFTAGLADEAPAVRAVAAHGVCAVLNCYWEIIPSATTASYVARITDQLAFDSTSPAVRVAALSGLQLLLDNQHAQPVLRKALPALAPLMHDPSPRVRDAFADLLVALSTSRGLHFWEVVPLEGLLGAMAGDANPEVTAKVHAILVPSYFPGPDEGVIRVAALLRAQPGPGSAFCRLLTQPLLANASGAAKGSCARGVQVPVEHLLLLAHALAVHLASAAPEGAPHSPPHKAARGASGSRKGAAGTGARKAGGKRRKAGTAGDKESVAPGDEVMGGDGEEQAAAMQEETAESWEALLSGLRELCQGIGLALKGELCAEEDVASLFDRHALQQLLDSCPSAASRWHVWQIAESLPTMPASQQLHITCLQQLASGQLLRQPQSTAGAGTGSSTSSSRLDHSSDDVAAVLACVAAGARGGKLTAMLCQALGVEWVQHGCHCADAVPPPGMASAAHEKGADEDDDGVVCGVCKRSQPEESMLLCDGCDAARHMACLVPPLADIPEGDWFCPTCDQDIRASVLDEASAFRCMDLLLRGSSGRQQLLRSGALQRMLPALAAQATQQAQAAVRSAGQAGASNAGNTFAACAAALDSAVLAARAAMHVSSQAAAEPEGSEPGNSAAAETLAGAVQDGAQSLAAACSALGAAAASSWGSQDGRALWSGYMALLPAACTFLGTAADCIRLGAEAAISSSGAPCQLAEAGRSALQLLSCGVQLAGEDGYETAQLVASLVAGTFVQDSVLLRLLLPAGCDTGSSRVAAWAAAWVAALVEGPLAVYTTHVKAHAPAVLAALVAAPSMQASNWLQPLARTAAAAAADAVSGGEDAENRHPNVQADGQAQIQLELPTAVGMFVNAARLKKVDGTLAAACVHAAVSWGAASNWELAAGGLHLAQHLNSAVGSAEPEQLRVLRVAAQAHKGMPARLLAQALDSIIGA